MLPLLVRVWQPRYPDWRLPESVSLHVLGVAVVEGRGSEAVDWSLRHSRPSEPSPTGSSPSRHASMQRPLRRYCSRRGEGEEGEQQCWMHVNTGSPMLHEARSDVGRSVEQRRGHAVYSFCQWVGYSGAGGRRLCLWHGGTDTFPLVHRWQAGPVVA